MASNTENVSIWWRHHDFPVYKFFFNFTAEVPYNPTDGPFTICDYGTADGGLSQPIMKDCVGMLIRIETDFIKA